MRHKKFSTFNIKHSIKSGFTTAELLVVLAIAVFILSIVFISFRDARANSRDARREEDIKQLQNALDIYHVNSRRFPICELSVINGSSDCLSQALKAEDTVGAVSTDPLGAGSGICLDAASHVYCYESAPDGSIYTLRYNLETESIPGKVAGWREARP